MHPSDNPAALFVYGTLKRGQINHALVGPWAEAIEPAAIAGRLYDLGDFPALAAGSGDVRGELVLFAQAIWSGVLARVDRLEGYQVDDPIGSLYLRRVVAVRRADGSRTAAWAYFYNENHRSLPPLATLQELPQGEWPFGEIREELEGSEELNAYRRFVRDFTQNPE